MNLEKQVLIVLGNWWKITIGRENAKKDQIIEEMSWHVYLGIRSVKQVTRVIEVKITSENSERKG